MNVRAAPDSVSKRDVSADEFEDYAPDTCTFLRHIGSDINEEFISALDARLGARALRSFIQRESGPSFVGPVWQAFLDAEHPGDSVNVALLHVIFTYLEADPDASQASLSAVQLNLEMTWPYVAFRLGCVLHDLGRSLMGSDQARAQRCFLAELDFFNRLHQHSDRLSRETQFRILGMGAVARTFLARAREFTRDQLAAARADLVRSIELGNDPLQALQYLLELDNRLYDLDDDTGHLRASLKRLEKQLRRGSTNRTVLLLAAEVLLRLADHENRPSLVMSVTPAFAVRKVRGYQERALEFLGRARELPAQDDFDRVRLELLAAIIRDRQGAVEGPAKGDPQQGNTLASIDPVGMRLPHSVRDKIRELSSASPGVADLLLEEVLAILQDAVSAEPTSAAYGILAQFLRLKARRSRTPDASRKVIEAFEQAKQLGDVSPENESLTSEAWEHVWRQTKDPSAFAKAVETAASAAVLDEKWGWPLFRLALLTDKAKGHHDLRSGSWKKSIARSSEPMDRLIELVLQGQPEELISLAAERVVAASHIETRVLGGRSETHVLEDPHGLLEHIFVLKPAVSRDLAEHERRQTDQLSQFVKSHDLPGWLLVPEVAGVFDRPDGTCIYVTRLESGTTLGDQILAPRRDGQSQTLKAAIERTVFYLAVIHSAWQAETDSHEDVQNRARTEAATDLQFHLRGLGLSREVRNSLRSRWRQLIPDSAPVTRKRDAHPGNWILTPSGVVAIDLSAIRHRPFLYELAQLLDDYPLLPVSDDGWATRMAHVDSYVGTLASLGFHIPDLDLEQLYAAAAVSRGTFVLSKPNLSQSRTNGFVPSVRRKHAFELLRYVSHRFESNPVGLLATELCSQLGWITQVSDAESAARLGALRDANQIRLSKLLSKVLRHDPSIAGVSLDSEGWTEIAEMVDGLVRAGARLTLNDVMELVELPEENRFEVSGTRIRARYGHSIPIVHPPGEGQIPVVLYHGTSADAIPKIIGKGEGLLPSGRQYVHLVTEVSSAKRVGVRHGDPVVLVIDARGLVDSGFDLKAAADGIWLVESVPTEFIAFAEEA